MTHGLNRQFTCPHSKTAIEAEMDRAEEATDKHGTLYPDHTFEDGVQETLRWILGRCPPPMVETDD